MRSATRAGRKRGFTVIELLVAMMIGLLVIAAATTFHRNQLLTLANQNQQVDLQMGARAAAEFFAREVRNLGGDLDCADPDMGNTLATANANTIVFKIGDEWITYSITGGHLIRHAGTSANASPTVSNDNTLLDGVVTGSNGSRISYYTVDNNGNEVLQAVPITDPAIRRAVRRIRLDLVVNEEGLGTGSNLASRASVNVDLRNRYFMGRNIWCTLTPVPTSTPTPNPNWTATDTPTQGPATATPTSVTCTAGDRDFCDPTTLNPCCISGYACVPHGNSYWCLASNVPTNTPIPPTVDPGAPTSTPTQACVAGNNTSCVPGGVPCCAPRACVPQGNNYRCEAGTNSTNTPAPTNTPGGPTNTPVPTNTTAPTNTPAPPTNTPANTNTPVPPTSTPVPPTSTPVPPTSTPVNTSTRTNTPAPTCQASGKPGGQNCSITNRHLCCSNACQGANCAPL